MTHPKDFSPIQTAIHDAPARAWVQWKGTMLCADITCACGVGDHIDAQFAYTVKCAGCGQVYTLGSYIELIPGDIIGGTTPIVFGEDD